MNNTPIFLHSLFRTGSTYMFQVFRRSAQNYWCYQEPVNEMLIHLNGDADKLLLIDESVISKNRHPMLNRPYFWEFHQVRDAIAGLFLKSFSYDDFFTENELNLSEEQNRYFGALISQANGQPVLQFCRSAGRIGALKTIFGGTHIHLWREPRSQWWSFKINDYFDPIVQLIYNAKVLPPVLRETKCHCGINDFHSDNVDEELRHARTHPLSATNNYFAFFSLWLYAFFEGQKYCDVTISIDQLSNDDGYCDIARQRLAHYGIDGIDFSDCFIPLTELNNKEVQFFSDVESHVIDIFVKHGYARSRIDEVCAIYTLVQKSHRQTQENLVQEVARNRGMVIRYLDLFVQAESRFARAEMRSSEATSRATKAEANTAEAQQRAEQAEARIQEAEGCAAQANASAAQAEQRLIDMEARAKTAEAKMEQLLNTTSWRVTSPLRWVKIIFRRFIAWPHSMSTRLGHTSRVLLASIASFVQSHLYLRRVATSTLSHFPGIRKYLIRILTSESKREEEICSTCDIPEDTVNITFRARRIYNLIKIAAEKNREAC